MSTNLNCKEIGAKDLINQILNPDREFSPIPFWFLNDNFDKKELKRQLTDFLDKGVYGVVLHPRIGVPEEIGYLSDEFFDVIVKLRFVRQRRKRPYRRTFPSVHITLFAGESLCQPRPSRLRPSPPKCSVLTARH